MRFSTPTTATTPMVTTIHQVTPNMSHIKKVFTTLVSKLPHHHQKVGPTYTTPIIIKNNSHTNIKVYTKEQQKSTITTTTALKKDNDMNRDVRNYYSSQQQQSRKRQLEDIYNKKVELERETRHKTVKQYQQPQQKETKCHHHHWKEHSTITTTNNNKSAQQPKWINTHGYLRDTRTNPDYLRRLAITHNSSKEKLYLRKRNDEFVWGKKSPLRNSCSLSSTSS